VTMTKIALVVGVAVVGFLCYLAAVGSSAAAALVITGVALVVFIGGGNWISGRTTPGARPPAAPASPATASGAGAGGAGTIRSGPHEDLGPEAGTGGDAAT